MSASSLAASELEERLHQTLEYAAIELAHLDRHARLPKGEDDGFLRPRDKAAAEALLVAYLASRLPHPPETVRTATTTLIDAAEQHIATARNEAIYRRFPQTVGTLGVGHVLLAGLGRAQPHVEALFRSAIDRGLATLSERAPFRLMDTRWTFERLDDSPLGSPADLLELSIVSGWPHPIYTLSEDDYALTHAIFYLTDFGLRPPPRQAQVHIDDAIDAFIIASASRSDFDLLAEFMIAATVLRRPVSPALRFGWEMMRDAWSSEDGLLGPDFSPSRFSALHGDEASAYDFWQNYHTRFVGGILCVIALTADEGSVEPVPPTGPDHRVVARLARFVDMAEVDRAGSVELPSPPERAMLLEWIASRLLTVSGQPVDPAPPWLKATITSELNREELITILYDALVVNTCRTYSLVQLVDALAVAGPYPDLRSSTFYRGLDFLLDQRLEDGYIGIHRLLAEETAHFPPEGQAAMTMRLAEIARALS